MLYTETLEDGRTYTYSDTYKIKQLDTGVIYDNAIDTIFHAYKETDIPLEEKEELTDAEFRKSDKVIYNNEIYESNIDNNIWKP